MALRSKPANEAPSRSRRLLFPLLSLVLALAPFLLVEVLLRSASIGDPADTSDPFVGFSKITPLFEKNSAADKYETSNSRLQFFGPQSFTVEKPADGLRIFCFGGSTVLGHPFQPDTSFTTWLELELEHRTGRPCEVINCGAISYASYRILPLMREALQYESDMMVVASGHNEFLEDRTYANLKNRSPARQWLTDHLYSLHTVQAGRQLLNSVIPKDSAKTVLKAEVDARLDHESGYASYHRDDVWQRGVLEHYEANLRRMVELSRLAEVPIIFVNLGSNLRDCPPFKSEHRTGLSTTSLARWTQLFESAQQIESENSEAAIKQYKQCEGIDADYALLAYKIARCFDRLGDFAEAKKYYIKAKDLDVCPLRMLEETHRRLAAVANETKTPLLPARKLLETESENGLVGANRYLDHVHPDILGHQIIGRALAKEAAERLSLSLSYWKPCDRRAVYSKHLQRLGDIYLAQGRLRVEWLHHWARRDRLNTQIKETEPRCKREAIYHKQDFGQGRLAVAQARELLAQDATNAIPFLNRGFHLFRQGRFSSARQMIELVRDEADSGNVQAEADSALKILDESSTEQCRFDAHVVPYKTDLSNSLWLEPPATNEDNDS